jgi:DNA-binding response OmpR family regulator
MLRSVVKVLIVEDDVKLLRFLARALLEEGFATDSCRSGADAIVQATSGLYDLILLDWMLPDLDGLSVCREVRRCGAITPILMLTARGEPRERVLGLESGADDYLVKPFEVEELIARIRALLRRSTGFARLACGDLEVDRVGRRVLLRGKPLDLTGREYAILVHLAYSADRVVSRSDLLVGVWETRHDSGTNVVEVQMSRLRDKLGDDAWRIETVRGSGYRLCSTRRS